MPGTQRKLTLTAKATLSGEVKSPQNSQANMADNTSPLMSHVEADSMVERITTEVLKGMEASFDKTTDLALKKLEACSSKIATLDTRSREPYLRLRQRHSNPHF